MLRILFSHWFIGLLFLVTGLIYHRTDHHWIEWLRHHTFDIYQQIQPREPNPHKMAAPVHIIDIDERSLTAIGQWPWPRTTLAQLVDKLTEYGAAVIGFDIVFSEADRTSPNTVLKTRNDIDPAIIAQLESLPSNEELFAQSLRKGRTVLGQVGIYRDTPEAILTQKVGYGYLSPSPDTLIIPSLHTYKGLVNNLTILEENATGVGLFSTTPGYGGTIRKVRLVERINDVTYPSLSLEMLRVALGGKDDYLLRGYKDGTPGIQSIVVKTANPKVKFEIPTEPDSSVWVHFARYKAERPLYISARDIILTESPEERTKLKQLLNGSLVILGTSAVGLKDIRKTPINSVLPGVEVHAQLLETILSDSHLTRPFEAIMIEWGLILIGGLLMIALVPHLNAIWTFMLSGALIALLVGIAWYYYTEFRELIDASYPSLAIFTMFVALSYLNYIREERERRQIKNAFSHYVSPALLRDLADNPEKLALGGETRNITVLFSDIRGFTTISERFNAQELTRFINKFLTPMTNVILTRNGTIDKYMGDAIMAFWNAPMEVKDHPKHACLAALEMQEAVKELNTKLLEEASHEGENTGSSRRHYVPINIGVGINTDDCCVGNMGSDQRFDYSALGDGVNLASRLEGQSKTYGVDIVLGQNTVDQLNDELAVVQIDRIQVKGKTEPVTIYALFGDEAYRTSDLFSKLKSHVDTLLEAYRSQRWNIAEKEIDILLNNEDFQKAHGLARLYADRVSSYRDSPPPADWDGVFIATSK